MNHPKFKEKSPIICRCNEVDEKTIQEAIKSGCKTLNELFDKTNAGVGPCGGSCRKITGPMLEHYLKYQCFPERPPKNKLKDKPIDKQKK